jgi:hypothetical protein
VSGWSVCEYPLSAGFDPCQRPSFSRPRTYVDLNLTVTLGDAVREDKMVADPPKVESMTDIISAR